MKSLEFENLSFSYSNEKGIITNLSFSLNNRETNGGYIVALMGASGTGKSTILKLLLRTLKPKSGAVKSNPANPVISYVPQEAVLFEHLSPLENARYFSNIVFYKKIFDEQLFHQLCEAMDMQEVLNKSKRVSELSGGQKQRILLLRALSVKPDFILLDEPSNGLDADVKLQFLNQLREIVVKQNIVGVYVTHHRLEAEFAADEVAFITENGNKGISKIHQSSVKSFIDAPPILEAVKIFNYPTPNILKCTIDISKQIFFPNEFKGGYSFIVVPPDMIELRENQGFKFRIISSNPIYSHIEIEGQKITVNTSDKLFEENMHVNFKGKILRYSEEQQLMEALTFD